ncbi:unnamed protein product [Urochloa humidicola]
MGLPSRRRFLNLIVDNRIRGGRSLRQIDLTRHKLFNATPPRPPDGITSETEGPQQQEATLSTGNNPKKEKNLRTIRLPDPIFNFRSSPTDFNWYMDCLLLSNSSKILCTDQSGRTVLFDADTCLAETMPHLHRPKSWPLTIFVPGAGAGDDNGGSLYIMDPRPRWERGDDDANAPQLSNQFEAFVYRRHAMSWQHQRLPLSPFVVEPKRYEDCSKKPVITSHAVVGGGGAAQVCLSVDRAGTYCLDTATHAWTHVGEWTLPFAGKVQYVPELELWFGFCATKDMRLGAADLSAMAVVGSGHGQPKFVGTWKEFEAPQGWTEVRPPQLVNLGSGRFCVARFFRALNYFMALFNPGREPDEKYYTVLTGTDVVPCVINSGNVNDSKGEMELRMIGHNSRCHVSYGSEGNIETVF